MIIRMKLLGSFLAREDIKGIRNCKQRVGAQFIESPDVLKETLGALAGGSWKDRKW